MIINEVYLIISRYAQALSSKFGGEITRGSTYYIRRHNPTSQEESNNGVKFFIYGAFLSYQNSDVIGVPKFLPA